MEQVQFNPPPPSSHALTARASTILFRRRVVGVDVGDDGVDLVKGGTSEKRRGVFGEDAERNSELTLSLSIERERDEY